MLIKYALAAVSTIFATSLVAAPVSKSLNVEDEPRFSTIKEFEAAIHANPTEFDIWWNYIDWFTSSADCGLLDRFFEIAEQSMFL